MRQYRATAYNDREFTFCFHFMAINWHGIEDVARVALDKIVANDTLHQKNGPWMIRGIDVGG